MRIPIPAKRARSPLALLVCCACIFWCAVAAHAAGRQFAEPDPADSFSSSLGQPVLRIVYTASTMGEVHPCPT